MAELFCRVSSCSTLIKSSRTRSKISLAVRSEMALLRNFRVEPNRLGEAEKPTKVLRGPPGDLFGCQVSHIRNGSRYFRYECRLVSLSPMGHRSQKRRIGFDEQRAERNLAGRIAQVLWLRTAHISA